MLNFLRYQTTGMEKINSNVGAKGEFLLSDFYWFKDLVKREIIALVSLTNIYNSSAEWIDYIDIQRKNLVHIANWGWCYA